MAFVRNCFTPSGSELESLRKAGLRKRKVVFKNIHGDHHYLKETLESYCPDSGQYLIVSYIPI